MLLHSFMGKFECLGGAKLIDNQAFCVALTIESDNSAVFIRVMSEL